MTAFTTRMTASLETLSSLSVKLDLPVIAAYHPDVVIIQLEGNDLDKHSASPGAIASSLQILIMEVWSGVTFVMWWAALRYTAV